MIYLSQTDDVQLRYQIWYSLPFSDFVKISFGSETKKVRTRKEAWSNLSLIRGQLCLHKLSHDRHSSPSLSPSLVNNFE